MIGTVNRTLVIASSTFTQLSRMKAFWFLAIFAVILVALQFFQLPIGGDPSSAAPEELRLLKSTALGMMQIFAVIFAIAATGLLIPRDLDDRTLYTILCKPVPRVDYLAGKYLGVLFTIFLAILIMDILLVIMLQLRSQDLLADRMLIWQRLGYTELDKEAEKVDLLIQANTWSVQFGVFAIFLKSMVCAGIALLISTFSRSTLFTIVIGLLIFVMGHLTGQAREFWVSQQGDAGPILRYGSHLISVIFPDFRLYNVIEGSIEGKVITPMIILWLTGISLIYAVVYLLLSWFAFAKKEF